MLTLYSQPTTKQGYCCHVNCEQSDSKQLNKDNVATFTVCSQTTDKDTVAISSVYSQITDKDNVAIFTVYNQTTDKDNVATFTVYRQQKTGTLLACTYATKMSLNPDMYRMS